MEILIKKKDIVKAGSILQLTRSRIGHPIPNGAASIHTSFQRSILAGPFYTCYKQFFWIAIIHIAKYNISMPSECRPLLRPPYCLTVLTPLTVIFPMSSLAFLLLFLPPYNLLSSSQTRAKLPLSVFNSSSFSLLLLLIWPAPPLPGNRRCWLLWSSGCLSVPAAYFLRSFSRAYYLQVFLSAVRGKYIRPFLSVAIIRSLFGHCTWFLFFT